MPLAFKLGSENKTDQNFRAEVIEKALANNVLDRIMSFISDAPDIMLSNQ